MAECVTVAATQTTLTLCIRKSVIAACALAVVVAAAKRAVGATTVTAVTTVMETIPLPPPLPPTGTEAGIAGIATTRAQISTRITAAAGATTPVAEASLVEEEFRISLASRRVSLANLLLRALLHQEDCSP